MSKTRKRRKKNNNQKQIAWAVTNRLTALIGSLVAVILVLIFQIGKGWWSEWLIQHRLQIIGLIAFAVIFLLFLSPIMVEASSNTKTLSGPGKHPGSDHTE